MSYQILINPMPKNCNECPFKRYDKEMGWCCSVANDILDEDMDTIHTDCPLNPLVLCDDCKHMEFDEEYKDYYCAKKGSANRIKVSHDFYCKDGEAK